MQWASGKSWTQEIANCRSRSASLVIAYVMKAKKLNYEDAFYFVKMKREVIYPNDSFRNQLMDLEQKLKSGKEKENCTIS